MLKELEVQSNLSLDDGTGLRVVRARFLEEQKFYWDMFDGYDSLRVLTYSASVPAMIRMLEQYSFDRFECVFRCENTLRDIKTILAFQQIVVGDTRAANLFASSPVVPGVRIVVLPMMTETSAGFN